MRHTRRSLSQELNHINRSVRVLQRACEQWSRHHDRSHTAMPDQRMPDETIELDSGSVQSPPTPEQLAWVVRAIRQRFIEAYPDGVPQRSVTWQLSHADRLLFVLSQVEAGQAVRCCDCGRALEFMDLLAHPEQTRCHYCRIDHGDEASKPPFFIL